MRLSVDANGTDPTMRGRARVLAERLGLPLVTDPQDFDFLLSYGPSGLSLQKLGAGAPGPLTVSFDDGKQAWRLRHGGGKGQLIARAIGRHRGARPAVLDATAGLGRDAFVMAGLGCQVTLLEHSPIIAALLEDALLRLHASRNGELCAIAERMTLHPIDALDYLAECDPVDLIYLDPMFPEKGRRGGVKKEMGLLRELLNTPTEESLLLDAALRRARLRVVVKRMKKTPAIAGRSPAFELRSKSTRYDIYPLQKYY